MSANRWRYLTVRVSVGWSSEKTDERLPAVNWISTAPTAGRLPLHGHD